MGKMHQARRKCPKRLVVLLPNLYGKGEEERHGGTLMRALFTKFALRSPLILITAFNPPDMMMHWVHFTSIPQCHIIIIYT
jgi:hypothetical protein